MRLIHHGGCGGRSRLGFPGLEHACQRGCARGLDAGACAWAFARVRALGGVGGGLRAGAGGFLTASGLGVCACVLLLRVRHQWGEWRPCPCACGGEVVLIMHEVVVRFCIVWRHGAGCSRRGRAPRSGVLGAAGALRSMLSVAQGRRAGLAGACAARTRVDFGITLPSIIGYVFLVHVW